MSDDALGRALAGRGWPARPLAGEPLAVDLLDTRWLVGDREFDVLADDELTAAWLADRGLAGAREPLLQTRAALAAAVADPRAVGPVDAVLDRGRLRLRLRADGPVELADVADPAWAAAWACARDFAALAARAPGRVRRCANPGCPLHFLDTSRTGERRWCSMAVCGNRSKARRHRERTA